MPHTVAEQADDLLALLDDAGIDSTFVTAFHAGAGPAVSFAARYPERTAGLFVVNGWARMISGDADPHGITKEFSDRLIEAHDERFGTGMFADAFSPCRAGDPEIRASYARVEPSSREAAHSDGAGVRRARNAAPRRNGHHEHR